MTEFLDLDALEAVARAATPGPWEESETVMWDDETPQALVKTPDGALTWDDHGGLVFTPGDAAHIAAFDPPTVLALIGRVREAEAAIERVRELHVKERPKHDPRAENCKLNSGVRWLGAQCRVCDETTALSCSCGKPAPCPTIRALGG